MGCKLHLSISVLGDGLGIELLLALQCACCAGLSGGGKLLCLLGPQSRLITDGLVFGAKQ